MPLASATTELRHPLNGNMGVGASLSVKTAHGNGKTTVE